MASTPIPEERHEHILALLAQQEIASLEELQDATSASPATTRRDLAALAGRGLIERTRGGARLLAQDSSLDEEFGRRRRKNARAKRAIAGAAAELVPSGASVFLNDGSTVFALAQELARRGEEAWIATNALNVAELLARSPRFQVTVIGGSLRHSSFGTIGPFATGAIRDLHVDLAFLGCDGIDARGGVRSNNVFDAEVARAMAEAAGRVVVMADSSKVGALARAQVVGWERVDELVTDGVPGALERAVGRRGVEVRVASA
jgi:DeoR/GlpR family transcriptional regulator of sugar metabolism